MFRSRRGKPRRQRVIRILILIFCFIYKFLFVKAALSSFDFFFFLNVGFDFSENSVCSVLSGNPTVVLCFASCHINTYTYVTRDLSL